MPGQRIYYVPPRLVGSVRDWSGLDEANQQSWLVDHVADLGFNAIWFSPLTEATGVEKISHDGKKLTGSYYATRNAFKLDPEFSSGDQAKDADHMKHFCAKADEKGIRVYADLVFNHIAADHPLVTAENEAIKNFSAGKQVQLIRGEHNQLIGMAHDNQNFYFKFRRNDDFSLLIGGPPEDLWSDVAQINYASPEGQRFFVRGDQEHKAYLKQVLDVYIDCGFKGFRCDAAYKVPHDVWQEMIAYAHSRQPDSIFLAETLGGSHDEVERLGKAVLDDGKGGQRPAFDLGMLGFYWWDMQNSWLPHQENPRVQRMSRYGGAGSPDTHDTGSTIAGGLRASFPNMDDKMIAQISLKRFAPAALACNSSYMQMGYEFCNEKQNGVFKVHITQEDWHRYCHKGDYEASHGQISPEDWQALFEERAAGGHALDIRDQIRAINHLKKNLNVENCRVHFNECSTKQDGSLLKIHCEYFDVDTNKKTAEIVMVLNCAPERGVVEVKDADLLALEKSGLAKQAFHAASGIESVLIYHTPLQAAPGNNRSAAPSPKKKAGPSARL